jgi:hypothetical protein
MTFTGGFRHGPPTTFTIFDGSDAGISSSGKSERVSIAIRGRVSPHRLHRHQNIVSIGERAVSFCTLTHWDHGCFLFNHYLPPAGFTWNAHFHLRWVLPELASDLHHRRLEICGRLRPILETQELDSFRILATWEEGWFMSIIRCSGTN